MSKLPENMKNFRLLRGLSQEEVGKKLNKSQTVISNWEKGTNSPDVNLVEKLCEIYKCTPNEIFGWDENEELNNFIQHKQHILVELSKLTKAREVLDKQISDYYKMLENGPAEVDLSNPPEGLDLNSMTNSMKRKTVFKK